MPEPQDQLRRLSAHRAEQIPAYVPVNHPTTMRRNRRPILLVSIAAAVVVALVAAGFALWPSDDSRSVHVGTPTTALPATTIPATTTTAPATTSTVPPPPACPQDGASTDRASGDETTGEQTYLANVNTQSSACLDAAVIDLGPAVPTWSAAYEDGPWFDTSGAPVDVPGAAHVVVRLAAGIRDIRTRSDPWATDHPGDPSVIEAVRLIQMTDGSFALVLGLPGRLPFRTVVGDRVNGDGFGFSIEFPASQQRTTCHNDEFGYTAALPEGWFVDTTDATQSAGACRVFGPGRFTQYPDNNTHLVYVTGDGSLGDPSPYRVVAEHSEIIDGSSATATEVEYTTQYGYKHAGELLYRWMFDGHEFALIVPGGGPSTLYDTLKIGADEIARSLRFD